MCFHAGGKIKGKRMRPVSDQTGELVPAGDQDQASRAPRQKRAYLLDITGVVEHYKHPAPGQQTAIEASLGIQTPWDPASGNPKCVQETADRLDDWHRKAARIKAPQIDIKLTIGEAVRHLMRPVHRQSGFPDAGHAVNCRDHHSAS